MHKHDIRDEYEFALAIHVIEELHDGIKRLSGGEALPEHLSETLQLLKAIQADTWD
jgi:hypothetical protein